MAAAARKKVVETKIVLATPWREFATANCIGIGSAKRAIAEGRLRVIQAGKKLLVTEEAGRAYLASLPSGPFTQPANLKKERAN
jgi:hypothetical protein